MKLKDKPKSRANYVGKLDRNKKNFVAKRKVPTKATKIKELEDRLDYQVIKGENFPKGSAARSLWLSRAEITFKELKKISGV